MYKIHRDNVNLSNWTNTSDKIPEQNSLVRALYYSEEPQEFNICLLRFYKTFSQHQTLGRWEGEENYIKSQTPVEYYAPIYWQLASSSII